MKMSHWIVMLFVAGTMLGTYVIRPSTVNSHSVEWSDIHAKIAGAVVFIHVEATNKAGVKEEWTGTGFIVSERGHVITNEHVVPRLDEYKRSTMSASIRSRYAPRIPIWMLTRDPNLDLALLKLADAPDPWKTVDIGDSDRVAPSSSVLAMGFPLDSDLSSAPGVLSSQNAAGGRWQTTAPLNFGNSGGPVVDDRGLVVAIAESGTREAVLINFLIPVNYARSLLLLARVQTSAPSVTVDRGADFEFGDQTREQVRRIRSYLDYPEYGTSAWVVDREVSFVSLGGRTSVVVHYVGQRVDARAGNGFVLAHYQPGIPETQRSREWVYDLSTGVQLKKVPLNEFQGMVFSKVRVGQKFDIVELVDSGSDFCAAGSTESYALTSARFKQGGSTKVAFYSDRGPGPGFVRPVLAIRGPAGAYLEIPGVPDVNSQMLKNLIRRVPPNPVSTQILSGKKSLGTVFDFSTRGFEEIFGLQIPCN